MAAQPLDADFPCWRYWVGLGEAPCTFDRCTYFSPRAPCACQLNDVRREHTIQEIAVRLSLPVKQVEIDVRRGLVGARRAVLIRDMVDGVA